MKQFQIQGKIIGKGHPSFLIAEVAQTHDGSLGQALAFIDAVATTGVDAIKFQTHFAEHESTQREVWRVPFSKQDATRYDYWKRMEFTPEQWKIIANRCLETDLIFLSSPFSEYAIDVLQQIDTPAWKVGSGEIDNIILLDKMISTKKPLIISTGMSDYAEIDSIYSSLSARKVDFALLHCTSEYPVHTENIGLNVISEFANKYQCPIGFSSHTPDIMPSVAAVIMGANIIENHVTMSPYMFGPDVCASLTIEQTKEMVRQIRDFEAIQQMPVDKSILADKLAKTRQIFRKSIVAAKDLPKGHVICLEDLNFKKPGDGLPVKEYTNVIGKKLSVDLKKDAAITIDILS